MQLTDPDSICNWDVTGGAVHAMLRRCCLPRSSRHPKVHKLLGALRDGFRRPQVSDKRSFQIIWDTGPEAGLALKLHLLNLGKVQFLSPQRARDEPVHASSSSSSFVLLRTCNAWTPSSQCWRR